MQNYKKYPKNSNLFPAKCDCYKIHKRFVMIHVPLFSLPSGRLVVPFK